MKKSHILLVLLSLVAGVAACGLGISSLVQAFRPRTFLTLDEYVRAYGESPLGVIAVHRDVAEIGLEGSKANLLLAVKDGKADVPAGKWRLHHWTATKRAGGALWTAEARYRPRDIRIEVAAGKELKVGMGEPLRLSFSASGRGFHSFSQRLEGRAGETVELARGEAAAPLPRVRIRNADGTYDRTFAFEYG